MPLLDGWTTAAPDVGDLQESYRILGILPGATFDDAKAAWRLRAQEFHPDRLQDAPPDVQAAAERQFKELSEAWRVVREHLDTGGGGGGLPWGSSGYPPPNGVWNDWSTSPTTPSRSILSNRAMVIVGVVALLIVAFVGYTTWKGSESEPYPDEVQSAFLAECQDGGAAPTRCQCVLDAVMDQVPYDKYPDLNKEIATTGSIPPELGDALESC